MMSKFPKFIGTFARDQSKIFIRIKDPQGIILNLDPISKSGSHWVSVLIDPKHSVEYYDSHGRSIPENILKALKPIIDKLKSKTLLKFKRIKLLIKERIQTIVDSLQ